MAIAVLAVKQRGTGNGTAQVVRQAGATATPVGRAFTVLWGTRTGTFVVGETVTGGTSGATGIVKNTNVLGFSVNVFVSVVSGTFASGETITGGTSAATLTGIGIGISNNNSAGLWPPEPTAVTTNWDAPQDRVLQFKGSLYCLIGILVLKYDGTNDWSIVHQNATAPLPAQTSATHCHGGLHIFYVNNQPRMGYLYGNTGLVRVTSVDGATFSELNLGAAFGIHANSGMWREVVWNNVLYAHCEWSDGATSVGVWDPSTDSFTRIAGNRSAASDLIVFQNQLLLMSDALPTSHVGLQSLLAGAWSTVLDFTDTGNSRGGGFTPDNTHWAMWTTNDGFLYCAYAPFSNPQLGWVVKKVQYSGGVYTDLGQIQATVLAGTGIGLYQSGGTDPTNSRMFCVVDDVSTPGTLVPYLFFAPSGVPGTQLTVMQWNGPASAVTNIGQGGDIANAIANTRQGGGERIWGPGQPDIIITNIASAPSGETISFIVFGGGTKTVQFFFGQTGQPPATQCTLAAGTATGGGTVDAPNKQILTSPADGVTVQTVKWNAVADGATNLTRAQIEPVCF